MNLIALIGNINTIYKINQVTKLNLKIQKPIKSGISKIKSNCKYHNIDIHLNNNKFKKELDKLSIGKLIGLKGRLEKNNKNNLIVVVDKIQIF